MPVKLEPFRDPAEEEYLFDAIKNWPDKYRDKIAENELWIFKNDSNIKKFIAQSNPGRIKLLLSKRNIGVVQLYCDFEKEKPVNLKDFGKINKQFGDVKTRREIIDTIINANLFAISTREVINAAYLIAQNCHSPYYYLNKDFKRIYDAVDTIKVKNLTEFSGETTITKTRETERCRRIVACLLYSFINYENAIRVHHKLDILDINILLFLFIHKDTFVESKALQKNVYKYSAKSIAYRCWSLQKEGYADVNRTNHKNPMFTISEKGIQSICEILQTMSHQAVNF